MTKKQLNKYKDVPIELIGDVNVQAEVISFRLIEDLKKLIQWSCEKFNIDKEHLTELVKQKIGELK